MATNHQGNRDGQQNGRDRTVANGSPWMKASDLLKPQSSEARLKPSFPVRPLTRDRAFSEPVITQSTPVCESNGWITEDERMDAPEMQEPDSMGSGLRRPEKNAIKKKTSEKKASIKKALEKKVPETDWSETERYEIERSETERFVTEESRTDSAQSEEQNQKAFAQRYNACLDWLSRREHSSFEVERKLKERFPDDLSLVPLVLARLQASGLQDDFRFAEMLVRYRASRGQGPIKIRAELKAKGVAQVVVSDVLSGSTFDWSEVASSVIAKKYGEPGEMPLTPKERARRQRFLQSRGFPYEHIAAAL
jgi:regulatory protein